MSKCKESVERNYDTRAIHCGQDHNEWGHSEIIPPIVTSVNFYQGDPTNSNVNSNEYQCIQSSNTIKFVASFSGIRV